MRRGRRFALSPSAILLLLLIIVVMAILLGKIG